VRCRRPVRPAGRKRSNSAGGTSAVGGGRGGNGLDDFLFVDVGRRGGEEESTGRDGLERSFRSFVSFRSILFLLWLVFDVGDGSSVVLVLRFSVGLTLVDSSVLYSFPFLSFPLYTNNLADEFSFRHHDNIK